MLSDVNSFSEDYKIIQILKLQLSGKDFSNVQNMAGGLNSALWQCTSEFYTICMWLTESDGWPGLNPDKVYVAHAESEGWPGACKTKVGHV